MNLRSWIQPRSTDERIARQEQLINVLALVSLPLASAYVLVLVFDALVLGQSVLPSIGGGLAAVVLLLVSYALSRSGRVRAAAVVIVSASMLVGFYSGYVRGAVTVSAMLLVPAVIFAGAAISGRAGIVVAAVEFVVCAGLAFVQAEGWLRPPASDLSPATGLVLIGAAVALIALVLWQTLRSQEALLRRAQERGQELQALADDKDRLLTVLQTREVSQRYLLETVRELGSPIIPLAQGIIALPLIGTVDSERSRQMTSALLQGVADYRARVVIVDITGVPVVDTVVAAALLRAAQGVRLLGATPILVGIRPEVARTLVEMKVGLEGVVTQSSLQDGLVYGLNLVGAEIVTRAGQDPASLALELQEKR